MALGILRKLGLRADAVANGVETLKALETIPYDLILMDVQMPEMDGLEATQQIRSLRSAVLNHDVPIIAMTAHAMSGDREICLKAGMNDYVTKPVDPKALADALDIWLPNEEAAETEREGKVSRETASVFTEEPKVPVFDRASMMARLMDDEELVRAVAESFLRDIPLQVEALRCHLEAGDAPSAERQAHTIKGASANVGGEALSAVAFEMEKAGKAGNLDAISALMDELRAQFHCLQEAMTNQILMANGPVREGIVEH